jgi:hypothetical protein
VVAVPTAAVTQQWSLKTVRNLVLASYTPLPLCIWTLKVHQLVIQLAAWCWLLAASRPAVSCWDGPQSL